MDENKVIKESYQFLYSNDAITIEPCHRPPSLENVKAWCRKHCNTDGDNKSTKTKLSIRGNSSNTDSKNMKNNNQPKPNTSTTIQNNIATTSVIPSAQTAVSAQTATVTPTTTPAAAATQEPKKSIHIPTFFSPIPKRRKHSVTPLSLPSAIPLTPTPNNTSTKVTSSSSSNASETAKPKTPVS